MRARVKGADRRALTVGSELGFLQVGKELELEDATTGKKRPARIDRVDVEIDPETKVPQLVVSLKYEDVEESIACKVDEADAADGDLESIEHASEQMKSAFARNVAKVTPALLATVKKMKSAALAYAEKKMKKEEDDAPKRMTAPPPAGALHATGRKVVRDEAQEAAAPIGKFPLLIKQAEMHKKKIAIGGAALALILVFVIGTHKHTPDAPAPGAVAANADPNAPAQTPAATTPATIGGPVANDATMANAANPLAQNQNVQMQAPGGAMPLAIPPGNISSEQMGPSVDPGNADQGDEPSESHHKHNVVPFGSGGAIAHGNILKIKMDGAIEKIEGAPDATGFSVVIPNRRSLEAAAPLAARDGRIASIKVTNDNGGAELNLQFKDGVPNYEVRARGDELEIVLAPIGGVSKHDASKDHPAAVANRAPTPKAHHPKKH
jgi:hypothetical protein